MEKKEANGGEIGSWIIRWLTVKRMRRGLSCCGRRSGGRIWRGFWEMKALEGLERGEREETGFFCCIGECLIHTAGRMALVVLKI
jgi:hypothetical protein